MHILVNKKVKKLAISNAVLSAARPRSAIAPVLFGVGVQICIWLWFEMVD